MLRIACWIGCLAALGLAIGGCVQANTYGSKDVLVTSSPPGAAVELNSKTVGVTPMTIQLERISSHSVRVSLDGYNTVAASIPPEVVRDSYLGAGLIDLMRASQAEPMPERIDVTLERHPSDARPTTVKWVDPDRQRRLDAMKSKPAPVKVQ